MLFDGHVGAVVVTHLSDSNVFLNFFSPLGFIGVTAEPNNDPERHRLGLGF